MRHFLWTIWHCKVKSHHLQEMWILLVFFSGSQKLDSDTGLWCCSVNNNDGFPGPSLCFFIFCHLPRSHIIYYWGSFVGYQAGKCNYVNKKWVCGSALSRDFGLLAPQDVIMWEIQIALSHETQFFFFSLINVSEKLWASFWLSDACQIQDFHTTPTMWEEVILKNAEVNADTQSRQTFFFSLVTVSPWTKMTSPIHSFPVHQWRGLSSVPEDLFRSGGLPCGSLPATLPLLPKLWTHPGRQCQ